MEPQNHYPRSGGPQRSGEELHREDAGMYGSPSMSQASGNYYDGAQQLEPHDYDQQPEEELDDFRVPPLTWQAVEFVPRQRQPVWYLYFSLVLAVLIVFGLFSFRQMLPPVVEFAPNIFYLSAVILMGTAFLLFSLRPPAQIPYSVDIVEGMRIGDQLYSFDNYRSFGVALEDGVYSLVFTPARRWGLSLVMYFPAEVGEELVDLVGQRLPMEEVKPDAVDRFIRRLRL